MTIDSSPLYRRTEGAQPDKETPVNGSGGTRRELDAYRGDNHDCVDEEYADSQRTFHLRSDGIPGHSYPTWELPELRPYRRR